MDFRAVGTGIMFRIRHKGDLVRFELPFPGRHNMENALAAVAASLRTGVNLRTAAQALRSFGGIHRRHQILGTFRGITLVDDFAHNPAKIAASIQSVQNFTTGRVIAWFQPHGYGPTRFLRKDLVAEIHKILRSASTDNANDCIYFSEIYYAGGTVIRDVSAGDLADDLLVLGNEAHYIQNRDACASAMVAVAEPGDTILLMGARDPSLGAFAASVREKLIAFV
jgi:UDP-N-acetylmuramate--alanine ligase